MHQEIEFVKRPMLSAANTDWYGRLENMLLQEFIQLERIENLKGRLENIEAKLD